MVYISLDISLVRSDGRTYRYQLNIT